MLHGVKVYILANLKDEPWGGGNQFLKCLKKEFQKKNVAADSPEEATIILFNSYQNLQDAIALKKKFPQKFFSHRLGPILHYHRGEAWKETDQLVVNVANSLADHVIFQSFWSYQESKKLGFHNFYTIIGNAVDPKIFNNLGGMPKLNGKVKLITTSWSSNPNKGFDFLQYLDDSGYTMTFIGNSPVEFKNIKMLTPLSSDALAGELMKHHFFIAPFKHEAASNAILEALACGLPVVALDNGGNEEQIKRGGELFQTQEELLKKIDLVTKNYYDYQSRIEVTSIETIADQYLQATHERFQA